MEEPSLFPFSKAKRALGRLVLGAALGGLTACLQPLVRAQTALIPAIRQAPWQGNVGIPGGIPVYPVGINVKNPPYNAAGNGVTDDTAAIQAAINAETNGYKVYLPTGTYRITSSLIVGYQGVPGTPGDGTVYPSISLGGDGPGNTTIALDSYQDIPVVKFYHATQLGSEVPITGGLTQGSQSITLSSASGISVGSFLSITELNDTNFVSTNTYGTAPCTYCGENGNRVLQQYVLVTSVSGNTLGITPPLLWNYNPALSPTAQSSLMITNCGVADMTVKRTKPSTNSYGGAHCVQFSDSAWCWATNVETSYPQGAHVEFDYSFQCQVQHCYLHDGWTQDSGQDYGVWIFDHNSNHLIQDCLIRNIRHAMVFEAGGSFCVFGYNCAINAIAGENADSFNGEAELTHGAHPWFNLYEGNMSPTIVGDYTHGSASHNTYFREAPFNTNYLEANVIAVNQSVTNLIGPSDADGDSDSPQFFPPGYPGAYVTGPAPVTNFWGHYTEGYTTAITVNFEQWTHSNNVVGCVFMTNGLLTPCIFGATNTSQSVPIGTSAITILGAADSASGGEGTGASPVDALVGQTTLWNANYDVINNKVLWAPGYNTNQAIPSSLYLASKPSWWGSGPWPAVGPDLNPMVSPIPALKRFQAIQHPPLSPTFLGITP